MGIGCFKEDELAKKKISGKWKYCGDWPGKKLTYVFHMHQINEAKIVGYDRDEIANEVIRAMVPSLTLRNVLETTTDLNLDRQLSFLESLLKKKGQLTLGASSLL